MIAGFRILELPDARGGAGLGGGGITARGGAGLGGGGLGGWEVTAPDGGRLLYPARPGAVPVPPDGAGPYDIAFLDLLGDPAQLGGFRAQGLITARTVTAVAFADHRVPSERELRRRCGLWHVGLPGDGDRVTTARSDKWVEEFSGTTRRVPWRVLVMGGARSGKSEQAEMRLAGEPKVTYVATGPRRGGDQDWAARVAAHQARRPRWWRTVETTDLAGVLGEARGAVLIDGIGTWLAAVLEECGAWEPASGVSGADVTGASMVAEAAGAAKTVGVGGVIEADVIKGPGVIASGDAAERVARRIAELVAAWRQASAYVVAVSDEAGLGVVPGTAAGRVFRDELGRLNQALAAESEEAELVVAGRVLPLAS